MARNPFGCGVKCSRFSLIALNVIFLLLGIALFVLGLVFRFGGNSLKEDIKPSLDKISVNGNSLYDLLGSLSILFIIVGAIIIGFSMLGFIGAACYVRPVLIAYAVLVALLLAVELAGVILFFVIRDKLTQEVKDGLKESIEQANQGNAETQKATEYMFKMDCYDSFSDWLKMYQMALGGVCIAVMIIQLMLVTCAGCISHAIKKSEEIV